MRGRKHNSKKISHSMTSEEGTTAGVMPKTDRDGRRYGLNFFFFVLKIPNQIAKLAVCFSELKGVLLSFFSVRCVITARSVPLR